MKLFFYYGVMLFIVNGILACATITPDHPAHVSHHEYQYDQQDIGFVTSGTDYLQPGYYSYYPGKYYYLPTRYQKP